MRNNSTLNNVEHDEDEDEQISLHFSKEPINKRVYIPDEADLSEDEKLQVTPLLAKKGSIKDYQSIPKRKSHGRVKTFKEDEESTKILELVYLEHNCFKAYILVPLLSICTAFIFLLLLHWYPRLRKAMFYSECSDLGKATHLFIAGTLDHLEIVDLINENSQLEKFLSEQEMSNYLLNPALVLYSEIISESYRPLPTASLQYESTLQQSINLQYSYKYQYDYIEQYFVPILFDCSQVYQAIHNNLSGGISTQSAYKFNLLRYGQCNLSINQNF